MTDRIPPVADWLDKHGDVLPPGIRARNLERLRLHMQFSPTFPETLR
jgi:hypothetical protein